MRRSLRWVAARAEGHLYEALVANSWLLTGIAYVIAPGATAAASPVGGAYAPIALAWGVVYLVAWAAITAGVFLPRPGWVPFGLSLQCAGLLMQFGATVASAHSMDARGWVYVVGFVCNVVRVVSLAKRGKV